MDKNKLCREVLNVKEVLELKIAENIVSLKGITEQEKKDIVRRLKGNVANTFNVVVDKILES